MPKKQLAVADRATVKGRSRTVGYQFCVLLCELLPRYQPIFGSDLTKVLVLHAVAAANAQKLVSGQQLAAYETMQALVPPEAQVPANALSISESTGIPRETVRRKIKELVAQDFLIADERGGYLLKQGVAQADASTDLFIEHLAATVKFVNACLQAGVIRIEADQVSV